MSPGNAVSKGVRDAVWVRDLGLCVRCGREGEQLHHRCPRGAGGSRHRPWVNLPGNLVTLCHRCHAWVESNRVEAVARGWIVPRNQVRLPVQSPCWYPLARGWFLLDDHGGRDRFSDNPPF